MAKSRIFLDHALAQRIGRVGLAGEDELHRLSGVGQDVGQPVLVTQDERRPLVAGEPPGVDDGQILGIEGPRQFEDFGLDVAPQGQVVRQLLADERDQALLVAVVGLPDLLVVDGKHPVPLLRPAFAPDVIRADVPAEQFSDRLAHPRIVYAVRDVVDRAARSAGVLGNRLAHIRRDTSRCSRETALT